MILDTNALSAFVDGMLASARYCDRKRGPRSPYMDTVDRERHALTRAPAVARAATAASGSGLVPVCA